LAFFTLASLFATLFLLPFAIIEHHTVSTLFRDFLPFVIATGLFQAFYFLGLTQAYRCEDLSIVYPIARALPVGLVPLWLSLVSDKHYAWEQYAGVLAIIVGSLLIPHPSFRGINAKAIFNRGSFFALIAALATTGYTLVDQHVLSSYTVTAPDAAGWKTSLSYMFLLSASSTVCVAALSLFWSAERSLWAGAINKQRRSAFSTAFIMTLTYSLVLIAMNFAENVGYIVALRQLSIPIGVLMGVLLLRERFSLNQRVALIMIMLGILTVLANR
jgi:drug/metabolite transporter (DMT)-like permease